VLAVRRRVITIPGHVEDVDREEGELADDGLPAGFGAYSGRGGLLSLSVVEGSNYSSPPSDTEWNVCSTNRNWAPLLEVRDGRALLRFLRRN
jgi:hypothetical protein